jgi:hypothetical protein
VAKDLALGKTSRDWSCGSLVLPSKQEKRILDKVDDVRRDVRLAGNRALAGALTLSGAIGLVAIALLKQGPK